jgi:hypothetical protein
VKSETDARTITIQCEQYGVTVHLFIGTGRSPDKITFMSLTFTVNHKASHQGLSSLFSLRSVPSSTFVIILSRSSFSHSFDVHSSYLQVVSVTEPPKLLGPPIVVLIQWTLDNPVDAHNHSTSLVTVSSLSRPRALHPSRRYYITSEGRIVEAITIT